jgi:hypothetical protein
MLLLGFLCVSCSTLQSGVYILLLDYDGDEILRKEPDVTLFLEKILESPEKYKMYAYMRRALSSSIKSSILRIHSFYVINIVHGGGGGGRKLYAQFFRDWKNVLFRWRMGYGHRV